MKISNNVNAPNFQGVCIQKSLMNATQFAKSNKIADATIGAIKYDEFLNNSIDFFILAGKNDKQLKIRAIDRGSGEYLENLKGKVAELKFTIKEDTFKIADKILDFFGKNCKKPELDYKRIMEGKTPLLKANPELYEDILDDYEKYRNVMDEEYAVYNAIDSALLFYEKNSEQGFDFNF